MKIDLSPENTRILYDAVQRGQYDSIEDAIHEAIRLLAASPNNSGLLRHKSPSAENWIQEFHRWSRKPRVGNPQMDDSRESIYGI